MKLGEFFLKHAVFTVEEIDRFLGERGSGKAGNRNSLLAYYQKRGRILRVRRGLYVVIPEGTTVDSYVVDPYLVGAKMREDAVLGYHTALGFHGKAYSVYSRVSYLSKRESLPVKFGGYEFRRVSVPRGLEEKEEEMYGVEVYKREGVEIRVTSLERTLVDVLDRPHLGGGWEEIWRSLESVEFFNIEEVVEYVELLGSATTASKVGFYLEQHREDLMVEDRHLEPLRRLSPKAAHYMVRGKRRGGVLQKEWNLIVPEEVYNRSWGEVA